MTKSETISNLKAYLDGDTAIGNIIPLRSVLESAIKYLEPSLPFNLDEAAEEYAEDEMMSGLAIRAFKAGAEWMAGQGYTKETQVYANRWTDVDEVIVNLGQGEYGFKAGDKVTVQIRKKV